MTITRKINGEIVEIELTDGELWQSFMEQRRQNAEARLDIWLDENFENEEDEDEGFSFGKRPDMTEEDRDEVIEHFLDIEGDGWEDWMRYAFERVFGML